MEPGLVATLPEPTSPEPASSTSPEVNELASSEESSASSTSPEVNELAEEPTPILVEQYIQPLVRADITMVELRRKVGHEKGKSWTSLLNDIVDQITKLQNSHATSKEICATLLKERGTKLGCLVICLFKLPRTSEGTIREGWENEKMCSNPRHSCNASSSATAKPSSNQVPGGLPASSPQDNPRVTPLNARQILSRF